MKKIFISIIVIASFGFTSLNKCAEKLYIPSGNFFIYSKAYNCAKSPEGRPQYNPALYNNKPSKEARFIFDDKQQPCIQTNEGTIISVEDMNLRALHKLEDARIHGTSRGNARAIDNDGNKYCIEGMDRGKLAKPPLNTVQVYTQEPLKSFSIRCYDGVELDLSERTYYNGLSWKNQEDIEIKGFCTRTTIFSPQQIQQIEEWHTTKTPFYIVMTSPYSRKTKAYHIVNIISKEGNLKKLNKHCPWNLHLEQKKEHFDYKQFITYENVSLDLHGNLTYHIDGEEREDRLINMNDINDIINNMEKSGKDIPEKLSFIDHPKRMIYEVKFREYSERVKSDKSETEKRMREYEEKKLEAAFRKKVLFSAFIIGGVGLIAYYFFIKQPK